MTTKSLTSNTLRFSKILLVTTALALGFGLESSQAALLTSAQAKLAAEQISASKQYNAAYTVAQKATANTGAEYAALNARLIAKYIDADKVVYLAAVINGVSSNYPNQQASIATQIISLDSENAARIVLLIGPSLSYDAASQLAVGLNYRLLKDNGTLKKAGLLAYALLSAINNSATGTANDRANEMAVTAANLAANLLTPNRHGVVANIDLKAFNQIAYVLASFAKTADTGTLTRDELVNNIVGTFASSLKASTTAGTLSTTAAIVALNRVRIVLLALLPNNANTINTVIQDVINSSTGSFGNITPSETPH
jgi:hypothetical protein